MLLNRVVTTLYKRPLVAVCLAILLTACGGSSGSVDNDSNPKAWGTATLIEFDDSGSVRRLQLALDANGNAIAVWEQFDGTQLNIWANRFDVTRGWDIPTLIESENSGDATNPQIAFDANGNAIAVWEQSDGTYDDIWVNRFDATTGWGTALKIENNDTDAGSPQIAFDANGNAIAVWIQHDGILYSIWANHYDMVTGWGNATLIENNNTGHASFPQIAVDTNGDALVVWEQFNGMRNQIWANHFDVLTGWGTADPIENNNDGLAYAPQIAFDPNGNAFAVWLQHDGALFSIYANRYDAVTGWGLVVPIETDNSGNAFVPQITVDDNGNALALWMQDDGIRPNIWANYYDTSRGWGTATLIETDDAGVASLPQVAFDPNGHAIAVWEQSDGTYYDIWVNRFDATTGWGTALKIENNDTDAGSPQIAFDANGNAIAVWIQHDGAHFNTWANRYE